MESKSFACRVMEVKKCIVKFTQTPPQDKKKSQAVKDIKTLYPEMIKYMYINKEISKEMLLRCEELVETI